VVEANHFGAQAFGLQQVKKCLPIISRRHGPCAAKVNVYLGSAANQAWGQAFGVDCFAHSDRLIGALQRNRHGDLMKSHVGVAKCGP